MSVLCILVQVKKLQNLFFSIAPKEIRERALTEINW
jgi:hypothetical protein